MFFNEQAQQPQKHVFSFLIFLIHQLSPKSCMYLLLQDIVHIHYNLRYDLIL